MIQTNYNPDVLSCLANLSNDEVFTPPGLANDILDLLPASIWRNPNATFLDPVSKSGVFLREIAKRLDKGQGQVEIDLNAVSFHSFGFIMKLPFQKSVVFAYLHNHVFIYFYGYLFCFMLINNFVYCEFRYFFISINYHTKIIIFCKFSCFFP